MKAVKMSIRSSDQEKFEKQSLFERIFEDILGEWEGKGNHSLIKMQMIFFNLSIYEEIILR